MCVWGGGGGGGGGGCGCVRVCVCGVHVCVCECEIKKEVMIREQTLLVNQTSTVTYVLFIRNACYSTLLTSLHAVSKNRWMDLGTACSV